MPPLLLRVFFSYTRQKNELDQCQLIPSFCDFINLQNGLYTVNLSNEESLEYKLTPPVYNDDFNSSSIDSQVCLKFMYPFGDIYYILSK